MRDYGEVFFKTMYKLSVNQTMTAVRQGLIRVMPLMIMGSFAVLVNNLPIQGFQRFMLNMFGEGWKGIGDSIYNGTSNIMSMTVLLSISYALAAQRRAVKTGEVSPFLVSLVSLASLLTVTTPIENGFSFPQIGPMGLFVAVIISVLSVKFFFFFTKYRLFRIKLFTDAADTVLIQAIAALEPVTWTLLFFALVKFVFVSSGVNDVHSFLYDVLKGVFTSLRGNVSAALLFIFSVQVFWFCGLHGSNILENVAQQLWVPKLAVNVAAVQAGQVPTEIFSKSFFDVFVLMGGGGSTICLIIALLAAARTSNTSKVTKISIPLGIFNINETLTYGIPIVFNPFYMIPFILAPVILMLVSYLATLLGLVPVVTHEVTWTTPVFIGGYVATGSWEGAALQLFNIVLGTAVYLPFVKMSERYKEMANLKVLERLNEQVNYVDNHRIPMVLNRLDEVGSLARVLAQDLQQNAIENSGLYMVFQPQIDNNNRVVGCEALLRWRHYKFGVIPPPTTITISEEAELDDVLNKWIFETSLRQLKYMNDLGYKDLVLSVNISPLQLHNKEIVKLLRNLIKEYRLNPDTIEVELTENVAFDNSKESKEVLDNFKKIGVRLAIDDFGMGHTSLLYLRSFSVDTVKLDGSLVEDVLTDPNAVDIIKAIVNLCNGMGMHVIAEVVESKEQRDKLRELGCHIYQGYYYSKPLEINNFIQYLEQNNVQNNIVDH